MLWKAAWAVVPAVATGGPAGDCSNVKRKREREGGEREREREREREGERERPHSADQMTSLLQLMFSGAQTQG